MEEQAIAPLGPEAELASQEPVARLHFAFARDRGVILEELDGQLKLLCRPGVTPQTLLEVRRVAGAAFRIEFLDPAGGTSATSGQGQVCADSASH